MKVGEVMQPMNAVTAVNAMKVGATAATHVRVCPMAAACGGRVRDC